LDGNRYSDTCSHQKSSQLASSWLFSLPLDYRKNIFGWWRIQFSRYCIQ
jgi:hypothetical protein